MAAPSFPGWRCAFYLPTTSDSGIVVLRKWLEEVAGTSCTLGAAAGAAAGTAQQQAQQQAHCMLALYPGT
jgi:hypothetical protein